MAWIESHDGLEEHPKLLALAEAMGWSRFEGSGRLHVFWKWCLKFAITGDLHKFSDAVLGRSVELNGDDARRFVKAMTSDQSCWIDRGRGPNGESIFRVHDWPEFTRYYIKDSLFRRKPELWDQVLRVYAIPLVREQSVNSSLTVGHTYQPTNLPISLLEKREGDDPHLWPMRTDPVIPPIDPEWPNRIAAIHAWYSQQMGCELRLDMQLERLWFEWFKAGFDEDKFKRVFKYLRSQIKERKRNDGALKLSNMLQPDRFGEDLGCATLARKPIQQQVAPPIKLPDVTPTPEAMAKGAEQIRALKESLKR